MKNQTKLSAEIQNSRRLYKNQKNKILLKILNEYQNEKLNKYEFISEMYKKYALIFELQNLFHERNIDSLTIESNSVLFRLKDSDLQFAIDKSCRSAFFEILNFGSYEHDEIQMVKNLLKEGDIVFDIGSHLGWYSINLANHYRNAQFYAFEPIPDTYELLKKNIEINKLNNVNAFNFGFSDEKKIVKFYYSEIGSAVASEKDIFSMRTLNTIQCDLKKLDDFIINKNIERLDFIKCDVEGAEFLIVKGGKNSIKKFLPILFLELVEDWCNKFNYTISDVTSFLFAMGYKMFEAKENLLFQINKIDTDKVDNFNYFFLHKEKHKQLISKYCSC